MRLSLRKAREEGGKIFSIFFYVDSGQLANHYSRDLIVMFSTCFANLSND